MNVSVWASRRLSPPAKVPTHNVPWRSISRLVTETSFRLLESFDGSQAFQELDRTIQAGKSLNRNTRVNCSEIPLGGNWTGSIYVRSDQPLVAVIENLWGNAEMAAYNSYSVTR